MADLLIDTQILVWLVNGDKRLRMDWIRAIGEEANRLHVSAVISFEYADLQRRNRLPVDETIDILIDKFAMKIAPLPSGAWRLCQTLPAIHRDPVDRMLVAHALCEGMSIVTSDAKIQLYPVNTI